MKLILMTTPEFFVEENNILNSLFEEGLDILHLRKPGAEPVFSERLLTLLPEKWHKKIVAHDHFYLKNEYKLKGIHISNQNHTIPINYTGHISRTCHSISQLREYKNKYNYVFLGPIYNSISHSSLLSSFSMRELEKAAQEGLIDSKVYAIGGIRKDNIERMKELGFGGVVVCGDLWSRFDLHQSYDYKELIEYFRKLKHGIIW